MELKGWNTWEYASYTLYSYLENGLKRFMIGVYCFDTSGQQYIKDFTWDNIDELGVHALDGSYSCIKIDVEGQSIKLEQAAEGDRIVIMIDTDYSKGIIPVIEIIPQGDEKPVRRDNALEYTDWILRFDGISLPHDLFLNVDNVYLMVDQKKCGILTCSQCINFSVDDALEILERCRHKAEAEQVKGGGFVDDLPQACVKSVVWNTIYEREKGLCTPVSRQWCKNRHGSVLFEWDTFLESVVMSIQYPELGYINQKAVLDGGVNDFFVPNVSTSNGNTALDRSQPPVGGICALKLFKIHPDKKAMEYIFEKLVRWHDWWFKYRDGNSNGLLEWGSNPLPKYRRQQHDIDQHCLKMAMLESGLDNSHMYDDMVFNPLQNVMELEDVGLNALYTADCLALSILADKLGRKELAQRFYREYLAMRQRVNDELWCEEMGLYLNKRWDGTFSKRISPTNFYPLIAMIPDEHQAHRMIKEHLLNPEEFFGAYMIPSTPKNDPAFKDNNYWRGRIWGPLNYLVVEGLRNYNFDDVLYDVVQKGVELFKKGWSAHNKVYENYNAITGEGSDVTNSDALYTWGNLLAYMGVQEIIDMETFGGLKIGSLYVKDAYIKNIRMKHSIYDIIIDDGKMTAFCNHDLIVTAKQPTVIHFYEDGKPYDIKIDTLQSDYQIELLKLLPLKEYKICINGQVLYKSSNSNGGILIESGEGERY